MDRLGLRSGRADGRRDPRRAGRRQRSSASIRRSTSPKPSTASRCGKHKRRRSFAASCLIEAYAKRGREPVTDDAQLVERLGHPVTIVPCSPLNIKITTRDDLKLAEQVLKGAAEAEARRLSAIHSRTTTCGGKPISDFGFRDSEFMMVSSRSNPQSAIRNPQCSLDDLRWRSLVHQTTDDAGLSAWLERKAAHASTPASIPRPTACTSAICCRC